MKVMRLAFVVFFLASLFLFNMPALACQYDYRNGRDCGDYTCTTNADTSPSICDTSCPGHCDLNCRHDNMNYDGCGDNCVEP